MPVARLRTPERILGESTTRRIRSVIAIIGRCARRRKPLRSRSRERPTSIRVEARGFGLLAEALRRQPTRASISTTSGDTHGSSKGLDDLAKGQNLRLRVDFHPVSAEFVTLEHVGQRRVIQLEQIAGLAARGPARHRLGLDRNLDLSSNSDPSVVGLGSKVSKGSRSVRLPVHSGLPGFLGLESGELTLEMAREPGREYDARRLSAGFPATHGS